MRINKETQYAVLFALYLARAGRATVDTAAANLSISKSFLQRVAHKLKQKAVITSVRGPGGGYELVNDIRLIDVFNAAGDNGLLSQTDRNKFATGGLEERALELFVSNLGMAMWPLLNRTVRNVMNEIIVNETAHLNRLDTKGLEQ
jgi:Rrf2 family iron-sulfur cluster assembly transcriptional regulator